MQKQLDDVEWGLKGGCNVRHIILYIMKNLKFYLIFAWLNVPLKNSK